jgi:gliding-associated putative ABC transporter substrate-binding component GldG
MSAGKLIYKKKLYLTLLCLVIFMGIANLLAVYFPLRIDLTEDKRYTLHDTTKGLLAQLKADVHVDIYLAGDLPTGFKQLQYSLKSLLEEFKAYARYPIIYQIIDINGEPLSKRQEMLKKLVEKGIEPSNLYRQVNGQRTEKIIYPGAIISYQDKETGVMLLKANKMTSTATMVSQSIENLEYEFISSLAKLVNTKSVQIGLVRGHGEPDAIKLHGLLQALNGFYEVQQVSLSPAVDLSNYGALLITKPQQPFSEAEKYALDQYIMQGGKVLYFLDRLRIDMDNLTKGNSFAFPLDINLDDQLFRYGVRINHDLIKDLQSGVYPIIVGKMGNQPQLQFLPWPFFPVLNDFADHVITKNVNALYTQFVSSIDPIKVEGIIQTPLVCSSSYSIKAGTPVFVDLESLRKPPDTSLYNQGPIPIAYLLEGRFNSLFKNRVPPDGVDISQFIPISQPTKILVVATGSMVVNAVSPKEGNALTWGYDPFLQQNFANQDFVLNTLAYMLEESGIINAKRKTIKLRLLDNLKAQRERTYWQLLNIVTPILILTLIGVSWHMVRRRKYHVNL